MMVRHVPSDPGSEQLSHWPLHGESQHTPSGAQKLVVHWLPIVHALPPPDCATQVPEEQ
jgi:hypothetical protein